MRAAVPVHVGVHDGALVYAAVYIQVGFYHKAFCRFHGVAGVEDALLAFQYQVVALDDREGDAAGAHFLYDVLVQFGALPVIGNPEAVRVAVLFKAVQDFAAGGQLGEAEPGVALFAHFTGRIEELSVGVQPVPQGELQGAAVGDALHGEAVHAGFGEVNAAAVPVLQGAVAHALVQEGVVSLGLGRANLFGLDEFRRLLQDVSGAHPPDVAVVQDRGDEFHFLPVSGVPQVLAFGVVYAAEAGGEAGNPAAAVLPGQAAGNVVGLFALVAGREFQHVHGEVAGRREHGSHHLVAELLPEAEAAHQHQVLEMGFGLGGGLYAPEALGLGARAELAGGEFPAHRGLGLLAGSFIAGQTGHVSSFAPGILAVQGQGAEHSACQKKALPSLTHGVTVFRFHTGLYWSYCCPAGLRSRFRQWPHRRSCARGNGP